MYQIICWKEWQLLKKVLLFYEYFSFFPFYFSWLHDMQWNIVLGLRIRAGMLPLPGGR